MSDTAAKFDVLGIGNAVVDVISHADDSFLQDNEIAKGAMTLIDADGAHRLYDAMGPGVEMSGGSVANAIAGVAALGGKGAYIGKVKNDQLGEVFAHDLRSLGVHFETPMADDGPSTARCLILVTPDAQRSMNTYLGACVELTPEDVDPETVKAAKITYLEGYLWDPPLAKEAFRKAMAIAHEAGRDVALTLSDKFCVDRYRKEFLHLVEDEVDILFANEDEIKSLYEVESFDEALQHVRKHCRIAALTRSEKGSVIVTPEELHVVDPVPVENVVDTTGAGDLYSAGFLYGLTRGRDLFTCAKMGGLAAGVIISQVGPRAETDLKKVFADNGL